MVSSLNLSPVFPSLLKILLLNFTHISYNLIIDLKQWYYPIGDLNPQSVIYYMFTYLCAWMCNYIFYVHYAYTCAHRGKRVSYPSEMEIQAVIIHLMWVPENKPRSSRRTVSILQC